MPAKTKAPSPAFLAVRLHRFKAVANGTSTEAERTEYAATVKGKRWTTEPETAYRFADQSAAVAVAAPFHGYAAVFVPVRLV